MNSLEQGLTSSSKSLASANTQIADTHKKLAHLIDEIGNSDVPTDDTPYLEAARAMGARVVDVFNRSLGEQSRRA